MRDWRTVDLVTVNTRVTSRKANSQRSLKTACLLLTASLGLAGCWQGQNAGTYQQAAQGATGDGVEKNSTDGSVGIRGAVLVAKDGKVAVVVTLVNRSAAPDSLVAVRVPGTDLNNLVVPVPVMPHSTTPVGQSDSRLRLLGTGLQGVGSQFVPVEFVFNTGGVIAAKLLVRAPEGIWADIPLEM